MRLRIAILVAFSVVILATGCGGGDDAPSSVSANDLNAKGDVWADLDHDQKLKLVALGKERLPADSQVSISGSGEIDNEDLVAAIDEQYSDSKKADITIYDTFVAVNEDLTRKQVIADNKPPEPTSATLEAVSGETGSGMVEFGFAGSGLAANIQLEDLQPSSAGQSYTTWITGPKDIAYPLNQSTVGASRSISGQVTVNQAIVCFIARDAFTNVEVSRVDNAEMKSSLTAASNANGGDGDFPQYVGETVMTGPVEMPAESKKTVLETCN